MARFLHISSTIFVPATNSNCAGLSAAISFGRSPHVAPYGLIAGGSGIVPLMAMLRHRERRKIRTPALLLYSSRSLDDVIYRAELDAMAHRDSHLRVVNTLTRKQPAGWMGSRGRIDKALLAETCFPPQQNPKIFVCGSTPFVEDVSRFLVELGHDPLTIKTERFGPSGGQAS